MVYNYLRCVHTKNFRWKFPVEMGIEEISDGNRCERLNFRWNFRRKFHRK